MRQKSHEKIRIVKTMDQIRSDCANSELMNTYQKLDSNSSKSFIQNDFVWNNRMNSRKGIRQNRTLTLSNINKYSNTNSPDSSNGKLRNSQQLMKNRHETKTEIYNKLFGWQPSLREIKMGRLDKRAKDCPYQNNDIMQVIHN